MSGRLKASAVLLILAPGVLTAPAPAEIVSIAGRVEARVRQLEGGEVTARDSASDIYPEGSPELPLRVRARLRAFGDDGPAAGSVAAQFADPLLLDQPNPQEFAINLALDSATPEIHHAAEALCEETRQVLFSPAELGPNAQPGTLVPVRGRIFLDGALAIFAAASGRDLTGATVRLRVTVVQSVPGEADRTVFAGTVELRGASDGRATRHATGDIPAGTLLLTSLSVLPAEFPAFNLLLLPELQLDYSYAAPVGQPFTLRATVRLDATNAADRCGVVAMLGAPVGTLTRVLELTRGTQVAGEFVAALEDQRDAARDQAASPPAAGGPPLPACGLLGLPALLTLLGLVGLRQLGRSRFRR